MSFKLTIMTPQGPVFEDEVESFSAPGTNGYFGVLSSHAPMVAALGSGVLKVEKETDIQYYAISGGVVEVDRKLTTILADLIKKVAGPEEAEIELEEMSSPTPAGH